MLGNERLCIAILLSIELTFLHFLATFRFVNHVERIVHVPLDGINETRIFLELTFPILDVLHALF